MSNATKVPGSIEWMRRVVECADVVYVRAKDAEGRWDSLALGSLMPEEQAEHVKRWIAEGRGAP